MSIRENGHHGGSHGQSDKPILYALETRSGRQESGGWMGGTPSPRAGGREVSGECLPADDARSPARCPSLRIARRGAASEEFSVAAGLEKSQCLAPQDGSGSPGPSVRKVLHCSCRRSLETEAPRPSAIPCAVSVSRGGLSFGRTLNVSWLGGRAGLRKVSLPRGKRERRSEPGLASALQWEAPGRCQTLQCWGAGRWLGVQHASGVKLLPC